MNDRVEWLSARVGEVQVHVQFLVHLSHNDHVVPPDDVQAEGHLLHAVVRAVHPLVALVQDQVDGLVEALQGAHYMTTISSNDGNGVVDISFERRSHRIENVDSNGALEYRRGGGWS